MKKEKKKTQAKYVHSPHSLTCNFFFKDSTSMVCSCSILSIFSRSMSVSLAFASASRFDCRSCAKERRTMATATIKESLVEARGLLKGDEWRTSVRVIQGRKKDGRRKRSMTIDKCKNQHTHRERERKGERGISGN